jgi:tetratricopeptide (TPR) repeat protein
VVAPGYSCAFQFPSVTEQIAESQMALGFGFNKAKVLATAEKYVQQGKLQNAISEYEKVSREDAKDLTVLNTIGDLYARLGQTDKATTYFRKVGDSYAHDGFTVKAIAMYKKLTKLNPSAMESVRRLAEFYTQQGLYNDARQQYVSVADYYLRNNDQGSAANIFNKMLELDPDNAAVQAKLADLYMKLGKKEDAKGIFFRAAESLHMRGALDAADEALNKILNLDPTNTNALMKRAQISIDQGDGASAGRFLKQIPNLDKNADGLALILRTQMMTGAKDAAEQSARRLAAAHRDFSGISVLAEWLLNNGAPDKALALLKEFDEQIADESLIRVLEPVLTRERENPGPLETLLTIYKEAGSKAHIVECTELLANALVKAGDLRRGKDLFEELTRLEPENSEHEQQYRQVLKRLGEDAAVRPLAPEEAVQAFVVDELEMTAPEVKTDYSADVEEAVKVALTDSELLDSYNLPEKALVPLEKVLPKAPRDARLNARMATLYAAAKRFADAGRCCEILSEVHSAQGNTEQAEQYAELATKYKASGGSPTAPAKPAPAKEASAPITMDISSEWETAFEAPPAKAAAPSATQGVIDEVKFYVSQMMWPEASAAAARCQAIDASHADLAGLRAQIAAGMGAAAAAPVSLSVTVGPPAADSARPGAQAVAFEGAAEGVLPRSDFTVEVVPPPAEAPAAVAQSAAAAPADQFSGFVSDLDASLGQDFQVTAPPPPPPLKVAAAAAPSPAPSAPVAGAPATKSEEESLLDDMFQEFKEDAEKGSEEVEDPETHYNLGVAFREMGLMDEAIGELQKVCTAIEKGAPFRDSIQAFTWLAQCFVDKGVPEASFKWYDKALKQATEEEQRLALHYDLASAYELAGNKPSALQHFMEVYGTNIDYRDVAERIKTLRS